MFEEDCVNNGCEWNVDFIVFNQTEGGNWYANDFQEGHCDDEMYENQYECEYNYLKDCEQKKLIDNLRRTLKEFFGDLTTHVINCYYQHDSVLEKIGIENTPPFPKGFNLPEWDISLLEPVYERGKLYRD